MTCPATERSLTTVSRSMMQLDSMPPPAVVPTSERTRAGEEVEHAVYEVDAILEKYTPAAHFRAEIVAGESRPSFQGAKLIIEGYQGTKIAGIDQILGQFRAGDEPCEMPNRQHCGVLGRHPRDPVTTEAADGKRFFAQDVNRLRQEIGSDWFVQVSRGGHDRGIDIRDRLVMVPEGSSLQAKPA